MDKCAGVSRPQALNCRNLIHLLCITKSWPLFPLKLSTGISTGRNGLPVENRCAPLGGRKFSPASSMRCGCSEPGSRPPGQARTTVRRPRVGHAVTARWLRATSSDRAAEPAIISPVCSITGDDIDRITAAIDQLACDARDASEADEVSDAVGDGALQDRVASLWQMIGELDPGLARRARRYANPADGGPSV